MADGAAFGSQMGRVHRLMQMRGDVCLYLPESFEWLILSAGILSGGGIAKILEDPSAHIDGETYLSWERFFAEELTRRTSGTWLRYSKDRLNPAYLKGKCRERIVSALPAAIREQLGVE